VDLIGSNVNQSKRCFLIGYWFNFGVEMEKYPIDQENIRIDALLYKHTLKGMSKSRIDRLIEDEKVFINGKPPKASYKVKLKDVLEIVKDALEEKKPVIIPQDIALDVLFEDDSLLVLNKARGMVVHPSEGKDQSGTMVHALLKHCVSLSQMETERPGIVHRIDKYTSGILVVAKNDEVHQDLSKQFEKHSIKRIYQCLVENWVRESGTINTPIGHVPTTSNKKMAYTTESNGKNMKKAITHYKVLAWYLYKNKKFSLLECQLETGRSHQIRVHLSSIARPIVGDQLYGPKKSSQVFELEGPVLHAQLLGFVHPITTKYMEYKVDLPEYFTSLIDTLGEDHFAFEATDPFAD
jgi:23S rRNA pseudouridine1911/1915/1917 synthase